MIFEKVLIFILFLGPLVFFHELGHFLFARFFGVKVEVFSIGFGPKLFKYKYGDTEYALSLIPLGGYVKMFGDDPFKRDEISESERSQSFVFKGKWARFCIVAGGPFANFIMAYVLFFGILMSGEKIPEMRLGVIPETSTLYSHGIRTGDIVSRVNGKEIYNPSDMAVVADGDIKTIGVKREGRPVEVPLGMKGKDFFKLIVKYPPGLQRPVIVSKDNGYFALSLNRSSVNWDQPLDTLHQYSKDGQLSLSLFKISENILGMDFDKDKVSAKYVKDLTLQISTRSDFLKELAKLNYRSLDLVVKSVNMKSAADLANLKQGDTIISLQGKPIYSFYDLRTTLQSIEASSINVGLWQNSKEIFISMVPKVTMQGETKVKLIGVYSAGLYLKPNYVHIPSSGFFSSLKSAWFRTAGAITQTLDGFKKLITAEVSFKAIGGPFTIGKVASDSFNTSLSYFFQLMALISVNLGVINLFPIPVLDGGHILFIILEVINRGPVSRRKMEIAQQFGLSILLMLMIGALFNDFTRFF